MKIVLASASPRRKEILSSLNIPFEVMKAQIDEVVLGVFSTPINAMNLSYSKGISIYEKIQHLNYDLVISADTIVDIEGEVLGKPQNRLEAQQMMEKLSGKKHRVITGYTLLGKEIRYVDYEETKVWFKTLSSLEIENYIHTDEPYDKAGGYGIQGLGGLLVKKIEGDYFNVVGLPLSKIYDTLWHRYHLKLV